jgi:hypothetical protein
MVNGIWLMSYGPEGWGREKVYFCETNPFRLTSHNTFILLRDRGLGGMTS